MLATDRSPDSIAFAAPDAARSGAGLETAVYSWGAAEVVTTTDTRVANVRIHRLRPR